jgi:hypothetical protein
LLNNTTRAKGSGSVAEGGGVGGEGMVPVLYFIVFCYLISIIDPIAILPIGRNFELCWKQPLQYIPVYQLLSYCSRIDSKVIL